MGDSNPISGILDPVGLFGGGGLFGISKSKGSSGNKKGSMTSWGDNRDDLKESTVKSANDYLGRTKNANNTLRNNVNNLSATYSNDLSNAGSDYMSRMSSANGEYKNGINDYVNKVNPNVDAQGYQKTLGLAQQGATDAAAANASNTLAAARSNNMSKGASTVLATGNEINTYNQALQNQQAMAQNSLDKAVAAAGNELNAKGNIYGQNTAAAGNMYSTDVAGANNRYSTGANTENAIASNTINSAGQDVANKTNVFNAAYNNQDVIEKLLTGAGSGLGNIPLLGGLLGGGK